MRKLTLKVTLHGYIIISNNEHCGSASKINLIINNNSHI